MYSRNRGHLAKIARRVVDAHSLGLPNWNSVADSSRNFLLYVDASVDSFGATLEQQQDCQTIRPIVFINRATIEAGRH